GLRFNIGIKLKDIGNDLFGTAPKPFGGGASGKATNSNDNFLSKVGDVLKTVFFDWERLNLTFNQTNAAVNSGGFGSTGFDNFWARGITERESQNWRGPSFAYQLGLVSNPHGDFNFQKSDKFPLIGFSTTNGLRPPNAVF